MEILNSIGLMMGGSWASGINLYMTIAGLGIAQRMQLINLPENMGVLGNPLVIIVAITLYIVEFVADKIPFVDSTWDAIHTFIRPLGGAALGYMSMAQMGPAAQIPVALITGTISMNSHLTKSTGRAALNTTAPIPGAGAAVSIGEDAAVFGILYLIIKHPVIATIFVILFILFSVWFLKKMFRFIRGVFRFILSPRAAN
jgi:hypothetical protein